MCKCFYLYFLCILKFPTRSLPLLSYKTYIIDNMKKIRIGNDIRFRWQIRRGANPETFDGKDITVELRNQYGKLCEMEYTAGADGIISGTSHGKDQKWLGTYTLTLIENNGKADMATVDKVCVWQLVDSQDASLIEGSSVADCGNVSVEVVELSSRIGVGNDTIVDRVLDATSDNAVANSVVARKFNDVAQTADALTRSINANSAAINSATAAISSATTRISAVESSLNAMNATRLDILTTGGSADEPIPVWTDSTRHDVTLKKRTQTFTGFTNIDVSNDLNANTDAAARLRDRRSWISSIRLRNFSGTKLTRAFMYCGGLRRLDTSTWDMSRLTTLRSTFHGCVQLEDMDTSHWDTHSVTDMGYTFSNCTKMSSFDVRSWDTSAVTSMDGTFNSCTSIEELDLSGWDTSQVQTVESMFNNCGSLRRLDIRYWDLSRCSSMAWFLSGCGAVEELYLGEGFGKVLNAAGSIDLAPLTKWTGDSVQTLLNLFNRTAHSSEGFRTITLKLSSQTKAALGTAGIQTLTSRGYTIA